MDKAVVIVLVLMVLAVIGLGVYQAARPVASALAHRVDTRTAIITARWELGRAGFQEGIAQVTAHAGYALLGGVGVLGGHWGYQLGGWLWAKYRSRPHWERVSVRRVPNPRRKRETRSKVLDL